MSASSGSIVEATKADIPLIEIKLREQINKLIIDELDNSVVLLAELGLDPEDLNHQKNECIAFAKTDLSTILHKALDQGLTNAGLQKLYHEFIIQIEAHETPKHQTIPSDNNIEDTMRADLSERFMTGLNHTLDFFKTAELSPEDEQIQKQVHLEMAKDQLLGILDSARMQGLTKPGFMRLKTEFFILLEEGFKLTVKPSPVNTDPIIEKAIEKGPDKEFVADLALSEKSSDQSPSPDSSATAASSSPPPQPPAIIKKPLSRTEMDTAMVRIARGRFFGMPAIKDLMMEIDPLGEKVSFASIDQLRDYIDAHTTAPG